MSSNIRNRFFAPIEQAKFSNQNLFFLECFKFHDSILFDFIVIIYSNNPITCDDYDCNASWNCCNNSIYCLFLIRRSVRFESFLGKSVFHLHYLIRQLYISYTEDCELPRLTVEATRHEHCKWYSYTIEEQHAKIVNNERKWGLNEASM